MEKLLQKIDDLEEEIREYEREYRNTINNEDRREIRQIIIEKERHLNILYQKERELKEELRQQQNYSSQSKYFI